MKTFVNIATEPVIQYTGMKNVSIAKEPDMHKFKSTVSEVYLAETYKKATKVKITGSPSAVEFMKNVWTNDIGVRESFYALFLNRANNTKGWILISQGGISGTIVDIKLICKSAVDMLSSGVILFHNHPSGNLKPSDSDIKVTEKIKQALSYFDIQLLDHIIITTDNYFSLTDEGLI